jgi:hypothetical protein
MIELFSPTHDLSRGLEKGKECNLNGFQPFL